MSVPMFRKGFKGLSGKEIKDVVREIIDANRLISSYLPRLRKEFPRR
jgi:hypothetical protein